ncbi:hypothetical protein G7047_09540 [Diaphorobacter sp. HDW4A]|uniref:hypothetical protein n=1 Tax=Diaphorobacter sp. HDW4A TaxID=2714924 RepID=UPI00140D4F9B|nr:hypothetical protein [Diaphorobacter sp. HDW4A]QIL80119.1 hypothetical protein G7047_09540 [Diaphorobacter sp. HDW4A]
MIPLTSEKVQGVLDDATYTATLCMARDGKHFFFSAIAVDGSAVDAPNKRWNSRRAALHALADIAASNRRPDGAPPSSPFLGLTDDLQFLADDLLIADSEPVSQGTEPELEPEPEVEVEVAPRTEGKPRPRRK